MRSLIWLLAAVSVTSSGEVSSRLFRHHYIAQELPGRNVGMGASALADFDRDLDLDFAVYNRGDGKMYWFEQKSKTEWVRHVAGELPASQLGCATMDVDRDGWPDLVVGGFWFRNTGKPGSEAFQRYSYDSRIRVEIHDVVAADMDGDGRLDVVAMGDGEGCFWYSIPEKPAADGDWNRNTITLAVRNDRDDIHSGFYPGGCGDLDGDGDVDVFLTDRWMENLSQGKQWMEHRVLFGRIGPWGLSARSLIKDLDGDGDNDLVVTDSDGQNCGVAWLRNNGRKPAAFSANYLANQAPGTRGSLHSLRMADFDGDGDEDILVVEQEDPSILPLGATPRWIVFENVSKDGKPAFEERVILDMKLGGHDAYVGDVDGDGDIDIVSKIWRVWDGNGNRGRVHVDWLENLRR